MECLELKPDDLSRVLFYIGKEEEIYFSTNELGPMNKILKRLAEGGVVFKTAFEKYLMRVVEDSKQADNDEAFQKEMNRLYFQMEMAMEMEINQNDYLSGVSNGQIIPVPDSNGISILMGFCAGLARVPPAALKGIIEIARNVPVLSSTAEFVTTSGALAVLRKGGGSVVVISLASVYLVAEAREAINAWWRGEIKGSRAAKIIIDSILCTAAEVGGALGGAAAGFALFGVVGAVSGGIVGGFAASKLSRFLVNMLTCKIFDLPTTVAAENAFEFFGLNHHASKPEVNSVYRRLSLETHPDKGGNLANFIEVQTNMGIIKKYYGEEL